MESWGLSVSRESYQRTKASIIEKQDGPVSIIYEAGRAGIEE